MILTFLRRKGAARPGEKRADLPDHSQPMPLHDPDMRLVPQPSPSEGSLGALLTAAELADIRTRYARMRRAQQDVEDFWIDHMLGHIPGPPLRREA